MPQVSTQSWQLNIHGMVDKPMTITFNELMKRPMIDHDVTLCCVSEGVGGGFIGNARWQGALLADLLKEAGVQKGATQIVMRDVNGMNLGVATDPVMDGRASLLAVGMNGQPLPQEHGFPVRVVVPGLYGYVSACKWVVDMELTTYCRVRRLLDEARLVGAGADQDRVPDRHAQGRQRHRRKGDHRRRGAGRSTGASRRSRWASTAPGIGRRWPPRTRSTPGGSGTTPWQATAGNHTLQVRATDKTGYTQTATYHKPEPNGATGYHTIHVAVA